MNNALLEMLLNKNVSIQQLERAALLNKRLVSQAGTKTVYAVSGEYIRKYIEPDFTNYAHHYQFAFVPDEEFWIDVATVTNSRSELKYHIAHLVIEYSMMKRGLDYDSALTVANRIERRYRAKENLRPINIDQQIGELVIVNFIQKLNDVDVYIVDGKMIRDFIDINFVQGGHDYAYDFIPKNEIWIDTEVSATERQFIVIHEYVERELMRSGMSYEKAHEKALSIEQRKRFIVK